MKPGLVGAAAVAALVAGGAAFWFVQHRGPIVAKPGEPLPDGATVQLQFPADENGDAENNPVVDKDEGAVGSQVTHQS